MATKAKRSKTPAKKKKSSKAATSRVRWTSQNDREMKALIKQQTPARAIAKQLDRTEAAVRQRIHKLGLSLRSSKKKAARKAK